MSKRLDFFIICICVFLYTNAMLAAQLVGSEITLCTNGYSSDGSTCTSYSAGDCGAGYYDLTPSDTAFVSPYGTFCNANGYKMLTLPDTTINLIYHGSVIGSEITLCTNGYSSDGSTCTSYSAGDCSGDYYEIVTNATSFVSPYGTFCNANGYKMLTLPDTTINLIYHGSVIGSEIALCANGYSADGSTCSAYGSTNCPPDFYNTNTGTASFAENNGACASGYHQYTAEAKCEFEPDGSTCVNTCSGTDELMTGVDACSALCGEGVTKLRTSTGLKYPLWATKQVTPSLNFGFANGNRCYVNLTTEPATSQTIWVQWENNKMHATK